MTIIKGKLQDVIGSPATRWEVKAELVAASKLLAAGGEVIEPEAIDVGSDGSWQFDLVPTSLLLQPTNAYYRIVARQPPSTRWVDLANVAVPDTGEFWASEQATVPGPLPALGVTQAELDAVSSEVTAHTTDTQGVHGIMDTALLAPITVLAPGEEIPLGWETDNVFLVAASVFGASHVEPVGTPVTVTGTMTTAGVTFTVPDGVETFDQIVAFCRGQSGSSGWTHPEFEVAATLQNGTDRTNTILVKKVRSKEEEDGKSYTLPQPAGLSVGQRYNVTVQLFRTVADADTSGGSTGGSTTYGGHAVPPREGTLTVIAAMAELAAGQSSALGATPGGYTELFATETPGGSGVSRTCIRTVYARDVTPAAVALPWVGNASGPGVVGVTLRPESVVNQPRPIGLPWGRAGYTVSEMDAAIANDELVYWAHRGGSMNWAEMSMRAYTNAAWHGARILEISCYLSSDGVWIMSHDQTLDRVTGQSFDIPTTASTDMLGLPILEPIPGGVIGRLEDIIAAYPNLILLVDNKSGGPTNMPSLLAELSVIPNAAEHVIIKVDGASTLSKFQAARATGFKVAGYWFETDFGTHFTQAKADETDYIGINWDADQTTVWDVAAAENKPLWGHVIESQAEADTAISKGAQILQCANVLGLIPQVNILP